jgi:hypothetical protein
MSESVVLSIPVFLSVHASRFLVVALAILGGLVTVYGGIRAVSAGVSYIGGLYGRTPRERRREGGRRLGRLGVRMRADAFTTILGDPVIERSEGAHTVRVYIDRNYYVVAAADASSSVVAYSVTTRSRDFRPSLKTEGWPSVDARLGETRFAEVLPPDAVHVFAGARRFEYWEFHYLGNPGGYRHFVLALNDAGHAFAPHGKNPFTAIAEVGSLDHVVSSEGDDELPPNVQEFRSIASPNTYGVIAPSADPADIPGWGGPDLDEVRLIPE